MRVILNISDSDKHFEFAIKEYLKRIVSRLKVENIKPAKHGTREHIVQKDTDQIISFLQKKYSDFYKVYLSKDGKPITTEQFADLLKKNLNVVFVVGGPYGLDEIKISQHVHIKLSFGQITLQHSLAKLVLLEQLYRIFTLQEGRQYHY